MDNTWEHELTIKSAPVVDQYWVFCLARFLKYIYLVPPKCILQRHECQTPVKRTRRQLRTLDEERGKDPS